ncbi:Ig-like domain-containing protein [Pseudoalteromonas rubra]|uniref:Ig-like domain-containing protein n=1 Tax=Pseudoalteromonas rubra TaxID=43658 RepID=UPI000F77CD73|nr:Ig-like domain-containing protein [Pseudoalteromonas rubra]
MNLKNLPLSSVGFAVCLALTGCGSDSDKSAPIVTPEKQPLSVSVTSLSATSEVDASSTEVKVSVSDESQVKSLSLLVNGEKVDTIESAPWSLQWDAYYWGNSSATISIEAVDKDNKVHNSAAPFNVEVTNAVTDAMAFGELNETLRNTDSLKVSFSPVNNAEFYEIQIKRDGTEQIIKSDDTSAELTELLLGEYNISYRATNSLEQTGPWSQPESFTLLAPEAPTAIEEPEIELTETGYKLTYTPPELEDGLYVQLALVEQADLTTNSKDGQALVFEGLKPGSHQVEARIINAYGHKSAPTMLNVELEAPQAPENVETAMVMEGDQHRVTFSWENNDNLAYYLVTTTNNTTEQSTETIVTDSNTLDFMLPAGEYSWQIQSVDIAGNESAWSNTKALSVGVYDIQFENVAWSSVNVLSTLDNGTVILSDKGDDNWLVKLDAYGNVLWEKTISKPGYQPLNTLLELPSGELVASGSFYNAGKSYGVTAKFSENGDEIWYTETQNNNGDRSGSITSAVLWNDKYYRLQSVGNYNTSYEITIQQIDLNTGEIVTSTPFVGDFGPYRISASELMVIDSEQLAIAGTLLTETYSELTTNDINVFVAKLDKTLKLTHSWQGTNVASPYSDYFGAIKLDEQKNLLVFGQEESSVNVNTYKLDANLNVLAAQINYLNAELDVDWESAAHLTSDGSVVAIGMDFNSNTLYSAHFDSNLAFVRKDAFDSPALNDGPSYVLKAKDGTTIFTDRVAPYSGSGLRVIRTVF